MSRTPKSSAFGLIFSPAGSAVAVVRTLRHMRRGRGTKDGLSTANTVAGLLPLVISALIVLRRLRGRSARHGH
ncbi:hypothetical protein AB0G71_24675 [Streptomyces sp. NPDC020403]|uniref:hypothetical protein n=1 Tax=unclassified Streptomyces TaxID=2593676 RepID=UPI00340945FC